MASEIAHIEMHPAAAIFPMLSDAERAEMAASIKAFGLREKIQIVLGSHSGKTEDDNTVTIIDGRNRYSALKDLGYTEQQVFDDFCEVADLTGVTIEEFVLVKNIERRNLTARQRKELAGKLAVQLAEAQKELPKEEQRDTLQAAADAAGVSRRTAATAKQEVLDMARSESEVEGQKPKRTSGGKKKAGPKTSPSRMVALCDEWAKDLQDFGHNFKIDEMKPLTVKFRVLLDLAESKLGVIAKRAAEEAEKAAKEAAELAEEVEASRK